MKSYRFLFLIPFAFATAELQAQKIEYNNLIAPVDYSGSAAIIVAGQDNRIQVTDRSQPSQFVGYLRSGVGIARPIITADGLSFTNNFTNSIALSLEAKGFTVKNVTVAEGGTPANVIFQAEQENIKYVVFMNIKNWLTDGYGAISLSYDIDLTIFSQSGTALLTKNLLVLSKELGGSVAWGAGKYKKYIPEAVKGEIQKILNDPDVKAVLTQ